MAFSRQVLFTTGQYVKATQHLQCTVPKTTWVIVNGMNENYFENYLYMSNDEHRGRNNHIKACTGLSSSPIVQYTEHHC